MNLIGLKLILTPVLIAATTLVARRWGAVVGGWFTGLPLTSGPISVFLAVERGNVFAAEAAQGSLLGLVGIAAFCAAYARASTKFAWPGALAIGFCAYILAMACLLPVALPLFAAASLTPALLWTALAIVGPPGAGAPAATAPWWDIPLRMAAATALVLAVTTAAGLLGARISGLLAPFPAFTCVITAFAHSQHGPAAARRFLRGTLTGSFGCIAFFFIASLTLERLPLFMAYTLAIAAALALNLVSLRFMVRE